MNNSILRKILFIGLVLLIVLSGIILYGAFGISLAVTIVVALFVIVPGIIKIDELFLKPIGTSNIVSFIEKHLMISNLLISSVDFVLLIILLLPYLSILSALMNF